MSVVREYIKRGYELVINPPICRVGQGVGSGAGFYQHYTEIIHPFKFSPERLWDPEPLERALQKIYTIDIKLEKEKYGSNSVAGTSGWWYTLNREYIFGFPIIVHTKYWYYNGQYLRKKNFIVVYTTIAKKKDLLNLW